VQIAPSLVPSAALASVPTKLILLSLCICETVRILLVPLTNPLRVVAVVKLPMVPVAILAITLPAVRFPAYVAPMLIATLEGTYASYQYHGTVIAKGLARGGWGEQASPAMIIYRDPHFRV
jgi:hypothetical protein